MTVSAQPVEACILAGGLSSRMGRDKSRLRLGGKTLLAHTRVVATAAGLPVRIIRRDLVSGRGPIGGIYTALRTTKAGAVLFLPCDMPFLTTSILLDLLRHFGAETRAVFTQQAHSGFPFVIRTTCLPEVKRLLESDELSLQLLARRLGAVQVHPSPDQSGSTQNLNTPEEFAEAKRRWLGSGPS